MLSITLTPSMLVFGDVPDELVEGLKGDFEIKVNEKGYYIKGKPQELYKVLLQLTYTYDIELS